MTSNYKPKEQANVKFTSRTTWLHLTWQIYRRKLQRNKYEVWKVEGMSEQSSKQVTEQVSAQRHGCMYIIHPDQMTR